MKPAQRLILFLHSFSGGVLMPILSLLLLERGCDLRTLLRGAMMDRRKQED